MTNPKPFYEIQVPKKETEYAFHLINLSKDEDGWTCMHTLLANKRRKRCPAQADETCEFCGLWTCAAHFVHSISIWVETSTSYNGIGGYHACPCEQCAKLQKEDMLKLRALRLEINR